MARYRFVIEVDISDEYLREYNAEALKRRGVTLPDDPDEWDDHDLHIAISEDIASDLSIETSECLDPAINVVGMVERGAWDEFTPESAK